MIFFTSDTHFFDERIMADARRPFASVGEMNEAIVSRFLARASGAREVYVLGDIFGRLAPEDPVGAARRLFGRMGIDDRPFHLVLGNHDRLSEEDYISMGFATVRAGAVWEEIDGDRLMLTHDPCMIQAPGTLAICGHVHTLFREVWNEERGTLAINVGVDARGFSPVSLDEIRRIAAERGFGR